jgi:hypothetical protein
VATARKNLAHEEAKRRKKHRKTVLFCENNIFPISSSNYVCVGRQRLVQEKRKFECRRAILDRVNERSERNFFFFFLVTQFHLRQIANKQKKFRQVLRLSYARTKDFSATALIFLKINVERAATERKNSFLSFSFST